MNKSLPYYAVRIAQRVSLLLLAMTTVFYWIVVTVAAFVSSTTQMTVPHTQFTSSLTSATNHLATVGFGWAAVAVALTLCLAAFVVVRKHEKRLLVDSVVIIIFLSIAILVCQTMILHFADRYLVGAL